jgi:hypothetical protein
MTKTGNPETQLTSSLGQEPRHTQDAYSFV